MVTIRLKVRKLKREKGYGVLYFQIIHRRKVKLITTSYKISEDEWDEENARTISSGKSAERRDWLRLLQRHLEEEIAALHDVARSAGDDDSVLDLIAERYRNDNLKGEFGSFVGHEADRLGRGGRMKTASAYRSAAASFMKYRQGADIQMSDLDTIEIRRYESWLKGSGVSVNSIACYMRNLRAAYNKAVECGIVQQDYPFKGVFTAISRTHKRALPFKVIRELKHLDLSYCKKLSFARDMFLLSFYMRGIPYIDMAHLKKSDVTGEHIHYVRHKTGQSMSIKLEPCIKDIIGRWQRYTLGDILVPILTPYSNYESALRLQNIRLKKISQEMSLSVPLTSYVPRHSWASFAKHNGVPLQVISEGMGHENEETTRIYLASLDQSVIDRANAMLLKKFLGTGAG